MYWVLVFLLSVVCFGQVDGPWTIWEGEGLADSLAFRVVARDDSTADLFYQIGYQTWYQEFDIATGSVRGWPVVISSSASGYIRTLHDALWTGEYWVLICYDQSARDNTTTMSYGAGGWLASIEIDRADNYPTWQWGSGSINDNLHLASVDSSTVIAVWVDYWEVWVGFWEAGLGTEALQIDLSSGEIVREGGYGGASSREIWPLLVAGDPPCLATSGEYCELCIDSLFGSEWWFPCGDALIECTGSAIHWYANPVSQIFVLVEPNPWCGDTVATVVLLDSARASCETISVVGENPVAVASSLTHGIAWLKINQESLLLERAGTNGVRTGLDGLVNSPENRYHILESQVSVAESGLIVVMWLESRDGNAAYRRLRVAGLNWDTPLASVERHKQIVPSGFSLTAYPNPFNSELRIRFEVERAQDVSLRVYDVNGREVATLVRATQSAGSHEVNWNASGVSSGVYFVRLVGEAGSAVEKVLLMK